MDNEELEKRLDHLESRLDEIWERMKQIENVLSTAFRLHAANELKIHRDK